MNHSDSKQYYLQDSRGNVGDNLMFWAPAGAGYTSNIDKAALFTEEAAFSQHQSRHGDVPWPAEYVRARVRPVVDMQYVMHAEAMALHPDATEFYLQRPGVWDGNDLIFVSRTGTRGTSDLRKARVVMRQELESDETLRALGLAWPRGYLDAKTRLAAPASNCNIADALAPTGMTLVPVPKPKPERYRCHGCGVFMSIGNYYSCAGCPRCGADNRP
jgi:hypothetical protein